MCPDCDSVHVALLRETVNVLRQADSLAKANADTLARANLFASVEKLLTAQQTKVQADVQHIYLYAALERKLQALKRADLQRETNDVLQRVEALKEAGSFERAAALLKSLKEKLKASEQDSLYARVEEELQNVERAKTPGLFKTIGTSLLTAVTTAFEYLIYLLIVGGLLGVLRWVWKWLRRSPGFRKYVLREQDSYFLALNDQTAPETDTLAREVSDELRRIGGEDYGGIQIELMVDEEREKFVTDETRLGGLASLEPFIADDAKIKVGIISIGAKTLFASIRDLFAPRYRYTIEGQFSQTGDHYVLWIEQRSKDEEMILEGRFETSVPCADAGAARAKVVRNAAAWLAIQLATEKKVTKSWQSLSAYLDAMAALADVKEATYQAQKSTDKQKETTSQVRNTMLRDALQALNRALNHDPNNWMARFKRATVFQKLGKNRAAAHRLKDFLDFIKDPEKVKNNLHCKVFLEENPAFRWKVEYKHVRSRSTATTARPARTSGSTPKCCRSTLGQSSRSAMR